MGGDQQAQDAASAASDRLDRELAAQALEKRRRGQNPTTREGAALRRVEKAREETQRWHHYRTIPQRHWRDMSGRPTQVLKTQAARHGIPFDGRAIDLPAVVRALHDFLTANQYRLRDSTDENVTDRSIIEASRRYKSAQADREERRNQLEAGKVRPTAEVDAERMELVRWIVGVMERAGSELQSRCAAAKPGEIKRVVDKYFLEVRRAAVSEAEKG